MATQADSSVLVREVQKEILDTYRREFDLLSATFRDVDSKAQGATAIAGIFLAAALSFLNRPSGLPVKLLWILAVTVLCLVGVIVFSIQALKVRKMPGSPSGEDVEGMLDTLAKIKDESELAHRLLHVQGDSAKLWKRCVQDRRKTNESKALHLWRAQMCLLAAASSAALLIIAVILTNIL
jgi:hypothetical protein